MRVTEGTVTGPVRKGAVAVRPSKRGVAAANAMGERLLQIAGVMLLIGAWWGLSSGVLPHFGETAARALPTPVAVGERLVELSASGQLLVHALKTLQRIVLAFGIVLVTAIPLGVIMGWSENIRFLLDPIVELLRPIPPIAWIPLSILWFGIGDAQKVYIICFAAFFPLLINTVVGVRHVNPSLAAAAGTLGATPRQILLRVVLPAATPFIFAGVRIAFGIGWMALVGAEIAAALAGLGYMIMAMRQGFDSAGVVAGMVVIGILGFCFDGGLRRLHRWMAPWHLEFRQE